MRLATSSQWFELERPLAEPEIKWDYPHSYWIERIINKEGDIVWFGQGVNWVKKPNQGWTVLGDDENVKPYETYYNDDGTVSGHAYPEGRTIWIPCEEPIYETLYKEMINGNTTS
jgi:hypothetical protein